MFPERKLICINLQVNLNISLAKRNIKIWKITKHAVEFHLHGSTNPHKV